jgi:hypothetical protein
MRTLLVCAVTSLLASVASAAGTLDIYVVDTEGGKAVVLLTPEGETMLVDAGYPTPDDRDTKRIVEVSRGAGIRHFDYVGTVDLFMVSHHGLKVSNAKFLVHALRPRVAVMNNGARKGGAPETLDVLEGSPGFQDLWQLHYSEAGGQRNGPGGLHRQPARAVRGEAGQGDRPARRRLHRHQHAERLLEDLRATVGDVRTILYGA